MGQQIGKARGIAGALIGAVNGFFGGGGGMIAVPLLERSLPSARAHATAIAVMLPVTAASGIVYALSVPLSMGILLPAAIGTAAGGWAGAKLLGKLPMRLTELLFGVLMLAAGLRMLFP